jgi:hypothetical protein
MSEIPTEFDAGVLLPQVEIEVRAMRYVRSPVYKSGE